MTDTAK
jgi:hypothetical protein